MTGFSTIRIACSTNRIGAFFFLGYLRHNTNMITFVSRQVNMIEVVFRMHINLSTITVQSRPRRECVHYEYRNWISIRPAASI